MYIGRIQRWAFYCAFFTAANAAAQEYRDAISILRRASAERERFFAYSVNVEIGGICPVADELFMIDTNGQSHLDIDFEYSRIGSHFVASVRERGKSVENVFGTTDGLSLVGSSTSLLRVRGFDRWNSPDRRLTELLVFDPRATGLLTMDEYGYGARFEAAISEIRSAMSIDAAKILYRDNMYEVVSQNAGLRIVFDALHAFWPVEFEYAPQDLNYRDSWKVQLGKHDNMDIPLSAKLTRTLSREKSQQEVVEVSFKFRWRSINRHVLTSDRAIDRISERLGVTVEKE